MYRGRVGRTPDGAQVFGNITGKGLVIQRDCVFHGNCSMAQGSQE